MNDLPSAATPQRERLDPLSVTGGSDTAAVSVVLADLLSMPAFATQMNALLEEFAASLQDAIGPAQNPPLAWADPSLRTLARRWAHTGEELAPLLLTAQMITTSVLREQHRTVSDRGAGCERGDEVSLLERHVSDPLGWMRLLRDTHRAELARIRARQHTAGESLYHSVLGVLQGQRPTIHQPGYELDAQHLALVLDHDTAAPATLSEAIGAPQLVVAAPQRMTWMWLQLRSAPDEVLKQKLIRALTDLGLHAGVGYSAPGADGFRLSHRQALTAREIAVEWDAPVIGYDDVSIVELAGREPARLRAFVERELDPLLSGGAAALRVRRTLRIYLANGQRLGATASICRLHRDTVRKQLAQAEQLLHRQLGTRSAELLLALRLAAILPPTPPSE